MKLIIRPPHHFAAAFVMLLTCSTSWPQAFERTFGDYMIRSSTASTENLSAETARENGIERGPRKAVLNVTILKTGAVAQKSVPAKVQVYMQNLTEQRRQVDMRKVAMNGYVSYMGTYDFNHGEVIDFTINAQPENSDKTLSMSYRERMWARGDLPDATPRQ